MIEMRWRKATLTRGDYELAVNGRVLQYREYRLTKGWTPGMGLAGSPQWEYDEWQDVEVE